MKMLLEPIKVPFFEKKFIEGFSYMPRVHYHNKHELYYLEKGRTKFFVDTEIFVLNPGDMIFIPANTLHRTENLEMESYNRTILYFSDIDFEDALAPFIKNLNTKRLIKIEYKKMHHIERLLVGIAVEEEKKSNGYQEMQRLYLKELLIMIDRYCIDNFENNNTSSTRIAESISKFIKENYGEDLSLARLSREFAMVPTYLSKFFKKKTGIGLNEYINITRIEEAKKLLRETDMSITQVAFTCGFNDSNYFAAVFKKLTGITPKKFSKIDMI